MENPTLLFFKCTIKQTKGGGVAFHFPFKSNHLSSSYMMTSLATQTRGNTRASMCECIKRRRREESSWRPRQLDQLALLILGFPVAAPQTRLAPNEVDLNLLHTWQKRRGQREGDSDVMNEADNGRGGASTGRARCTASGNRQTSKTTVSWSSFIGPADAKKQQKPD